MNVVIVFESMFGNTESLAGDVKDGLEDSDAHVALVEVGAARASDFAGCDLLVVAAPTHALSLSRPQSRAQAVSNGANPLRAETGVREWLSAIGQALPEDSHRPVVAVFDTRVAKARHWPGSAARRAVRTLRQSRFTVVAQVSFFVEDISGPLSTGEHERAYSWGRTLTTSAEMAGAHGPQR